MTDYLEINYNKNMEMLSLAVKYCEKNFLHKDIINELYNDNDLKKQLCLIELKKVENQKESDILVYNLTQHSGPIRETASFKILELIKMSEFQHFFQTENIMSTFANAVIDINPSVSRNTVEIIKYIDNPQFMYDKFVKEINKTLNELKDIKQVKSYCANKKNFNLYWNLEAIINISNKITSGKELDEILEKTAKSNDYTIREKTAKCACKFKLSKILDMLKNDENIYVKKYIPL